MHWRSAYRYHRCFYNPFTFPFRLPYRPSLSLNPSFLAVPSFGEMTTSSDVAYFGAPMPTDVNSTFNASMNATSADAQPLFIATLNPITLIYHLLTHPKIRVSSKNCK
jgi:hypothetical protein